MKLIKPSHEESLAVKDELGYSLSRMSENRVWFLGIKPVLFGYRVVAWRKGSCGCCVDYCAASDIDFLNLLMPTLISIFTCLPEDITEAQVSAMMPGWEIRPINKDPSCWRELQGLAIALSDQAEV